MLRFVCIAGAAVLSLLACTSVHRERGVTVTTLQVHEEKPNYYYNAQIPEIRGIANRETQQLINERLRVLAERQKRMFLRDLSALPVQTGAIVKSGMTIAYKATRADQKLVSVIYIMSPYIAGAAHPNHFTVSFNYDVAARKEISLEQLFKDNSYLKTLSEIALEKLTTQSRSAGTYYDGKEALIKKGTRPSINTFRSYSIGSDAITFHFDPYEVGSYAEGIQLVTLSGAVLGKQLSPMGEAFLLPQ